MVVHLGSHIADMEAITAALECRPQVVVLSDADVGAETAWAKLFTQIVHSEELKSFQGALVVSVEHEDRIPKDLCSSRWAASEGCLRTAAISVGVRVIDDLCAEDKSDETHASLRAEVSELAQLFFDDAEEGGKTDIATIASQQAWTVAALLSTDASGKDGLVGYVTYNAEPALDALCLHRVATSAKYRRRGHASYLVRWMMTRARKDGCDNLCMNAVPRLQTINSSLGFTYLDPEDALVPAADRKSAWMSFSFEEAPSKTATVSNKKDKRRKKKEAPVRRK